MKVRLIMLFISLFGLGLGYAMNDAYGKSRYYGQNLCHSAKYYCINIARGDTWHKLFPNKKQRKLVMRLNRTNIALYYRKWILVPHNLSNANLMSISPFNRKIKPRNDKLVLIDLRKHAFAAYDAGGYQVHWGPVSGGKGWCTDVGKPCHTVIGRFKVERKQGDECISKKFPLPDGGAEMPYCMFFYKGYAMHGSQLPGFHASHGCVRMLNDDAEWMNTNFIETGRHGTEVIVIR